MKQKPIGLVLMILLLSGIGCGDAEKAKTEAAVNHFVTAAKAIAEGDHEAAIIELTASIEQKPSAWAYFQRAKVLLETGKESEAAEDCVKGMEVDPKHLDLKWLAGEIKKPAAKRFKGRFKYPPSGRK